MQTILGANGQIGTELAKSLHDHHTQDLRLVSRTPSALHDTDEVVPANLLDPQQTSAAVAGSEIVYFTVGLPANTRLWVEQFPTMLRNTLDACIARGAKLVFFDNTYMYPKTATPQTEHTRFEPIGPKAVVRNAMATMVLEEMASGRIEALIARAPEFYGPGKTQGVTNALFLDPIAAGKNPRIPISDSTRRSLIWTPDASAAMALLGNTPSAYRRTWHLPIDENRPTYAELTDLAAEAWGRELKPKVLSRAVLTAARPFSTQVQQIWELLPRYAVDNIFVTDTFADAFPDFRVTTYAQGIRALRDQADRQQG